MATVDELCPWLSPAKALHLQRLVRTWGTLADIAFADLLLFVPVDGKVANGLVIADQVRPTTSRSLYLRDLVGELIPANERPLLVRAYEEGATIDGGMIQREIAPRVRILGVPVLYRDSPCAVLSREFSPDAQRDPGMLELTYFKLFRRLARMIAEGNYPFPVDDIETEESPRVSDGLLLLDASGRVEFISPNAASALHRLGMHGEVEGRHLAEVGLEQRAIRAALTSRLPQTEDIEHRDGDTVVLRALPLIEADEVTGGLVLMRDISEMRRRDRLLLSKDATIAEIHHRVKNNLQTISSLLRLQGRRLVAAEAREAIEESVRRIRSIAIVHEILSHEVRDDVPFVDVVRPLVRMAEEGLVSSDRPVQLKMGGDAGELPTNLATPLAVVLTELLQNALDHAFPHTDEPTGGEVSIEFDNDGERLSMRVADDGVGLPDDFDIEKAQGLGLVIVRSLVRGDLAGSISLCPGDGPDGRPGTVVELLVPLVPTWDAGTAGS